MKIQKLILTALLAATLATCETYQDEVVETQSAITFPLSGASVGKVTTNPASVNGIARSSRANVSMQQVTQGGSTSYHLARTDMTNGAFFSCPIITFELKSGSFSTPPVPRGLTGLQNYYQQKLDATCTMGGATYTIKHTSTGPWRIYGATPYPSPGENMVGVEKADFACCGAGNVTGSGPITFSLVSNLDPGVTLTNQKHYVWPEHPNDPLNFDRQVRAEEIVWNWTAGMSTVRTPEVRWITENCTGGIFDPNYNPQQCLRGWEDGGYYDMEISLDHDMGSAGYNGLPPAPPLVRIYQGSFAHELCHAYKQVTTGDGDPNHTSDCFCNANEVIDPYFHPTATSPCMWPRHWWDGTWERWDGEHGLAGQWNVELFNRDY